MRHPIKQRMPLSDPKPDLYFGFPMRGPISHQRRGLERSAPSFNFEIDRLNELSAKGLVSSPSTGKTHDHCVCFPFAVVELKHTLVCQSQEQFCYCQAANAASAALTILENLYTCSDRGRNNDHVPPVVAFTCIGPRIRVWIAYSYRERPGPPVHVRSNSQSAQICTNVVHS